MGKRATLRGSTLRARPLEEKASHRRAVERERAARLRARRARRVPVIETFPLDEVAAAYDRFTAGAKFGKIVLTADCSRGRCINRGLSSRPPAALP